MALAFPVVASDKLSNAGEDGFAVICSVGGAGAPGSEATGVVTAGAAALEGPAGTCVIGATECFRVKSKVTAINTIAAIDTRISAVYVDRVCDLACDDADITFSAVHDRVSRLARARAALPE